MTTIIDNSSHPSIEIHMDSTENDLNYDELFVYNNLSSISKYCHESINWQHIVSQLREKIFNSSSAACPAPESYWFNKTGQYEHIAYDTSLQSVANNRFNSDPFYTADAFKYRQFRSENLLLRMMQLESIKMNLLTLIRLSKGVFIHQKWQSSQPHSSPTMSAIEDYSSINYGSTYEAPIDTFQHDNMYQMMHTSLTDSCYDIFTPYSYTLGARYTNPYKSKDIIIRGKIPLWCQTSFLAECMKIDNVEAYKAYSGLFVFAPRITVTFRPLLTYDENMYDQCMVLPELLLIYEKFTMEHIDLNCPEEIDYSCQWTLQKKTILQNVFICDISDELAKMLSQMSSLWIAM